MTFTTKLIFLKIFKNNNIPNFCFVFCLKSIDADAMISSFEFVRRPLKIKLFKQISVFSQTRFSSWLVPAVAKVGHTNLGSSCGWTSWCTFHNVPTPPSLAMSPGLLWRMLSHFNLHASICELWYWHRPGKESEKSKQNLLSPEIPWGNRSI